MAYNGNIPQPTDQMSQSQQDLLDNFTEINNFVNTDHGPFNGATQGQHVKVTLPNAAPPVFPNPNTDIGFYNANGVTSTLPEGYVHKHIAGPANIDVPFTESILGTNASPGLTSGWTYLPSGILLKWGTSLAAASSTTNINVNGGGSLGPNFTQVFNVQGCQRNTSTTPVAFTFAALPNINLINNNAVGVNVFWFVVGRGV